MKLKDRIKTYNFWVSLSAAVLILVNTLGQTFGFNVNDGLINNIIMSICGVLVVLGFVAPQKENVPSNLKKIEPVKEIEIKIEEDENKVAEEDTITNEKNKDVLDITKEK